MALQEAPQSIVVLRALQLGDLLCTVPAFRALRTTYPNARVTLVGLPWSAGFVQRFSHYLDDFIEFPGWPGLPEMEMDVEKIPTFLKEVQGRHFDLAIQMQGSGYLTNPLITLFGARKSAGFYLLDQFCPDEESFAIYPEGAPEIHIFLRLMSFLGVPAQGDALEFPVTKAEEKGFEQFLKTYQLQPRSYVCIHPGARDMARRWSPQKFARLGDELARLGYRIVLTGTLSEKFLTSAVAENMRFPALDVAGLTDLSTLALLLANARLLISNDTGVSHLAAAFQVPSVILFSTSDPRRWRPLNHQLHRAIANASTATEEDVLAEVDQLLREARTYA